jgi:hypothetical protein
MAINSSPARRRTRHWSRNVYRAYPSIAGLWYPSSMYGNQPAVALYERAGHALPPLPFFHESLTHPDLLAPLQNIANDINYDLP